MCPRLANSYVTKAFLGLASYYRRFIHNFAQITAPLNRLLEKGKRWQWTEQCSQAFTLLKTKLTSAPLLVYPNFEEAFIVDCDASDDGLGTVLSQNHQGAEHVVYYASRTLSKAERKYCATRKEMLALVWAIDQFRPYLYGRPFIVRTDHHALQWLRSFKEPEGQVARWLEHLEEYEFTVQHRPGKKHGNADPLSRYPCHQCSNQPVGVHATTDQRGSNVGGWALQWSKQEVIQFQTDDPDIGQMKRWMKGLLQTCPHNASKVLKSLWSQKTNLVLVDDVLYRSWKDVAGKGLNNCLQMVVPHVLVPSILAELHDAPTGGHLGVAKVLEKAQQRFYWVGQRQDVDEWCRTCTRCGAQKSPAKHTYGSRHDQGRNFESNLVKEICRLLEILKTRTTPYHPQSDGMIERFNRTLLSMLKRATIDAERDWDLKLPCLMMAYRTSIHETTKATPFSLMFGREVQLPIDIMFGCNYYQYLRVCQGSGATQVVHFDRLKPYLTRHLDDEPMPRESGREEHSLDETTENEALIQDRSTDETTSESQYEEVLVEREDDTLVRQTEPDMLQGVEHGTESQLVETGDATEEDPENLVPEMDDNMENEEEAQGTPEAPEEEGLRRSTRERRPPERFGT
eukprot:Em0021g479a